MKNYSYNWKMFGYGGDRSNFANSCMIEGRVKIHAFFFMVFLTTSIALTVLCVFRFLSSSFLIFYRKHDCGCIWFHSSYSGLFSRVCGIFEGGRCLFVNRIFTLEWKKKRNKYFSKKLVVLKSTPFSGSSYVC